MSDRRSVLVWCIGASIGAAVGYASGTYTQHAIHLRSLGGAVRPPKPLNSLPGVSGQPTPQTTVSGPPVGGYRRCTSRSDDGTMRCVVYGPHGDDEHLWAPVEGRQ